MDDRWEKSAAAWVTEIGEHGDWGRRYVLDRVMLGRIGGRQFVRALDVGRGVGRFCRMLKAYGIPYVGIRSDRPASRGCSPAGHGWRVRFGSGRGATVRCGVV